MSATVTAPAHAPPASKSRAPARPSWMAMLNFIPNIVVFALLGGVMYVGHHTGWKLPKLSELRGTAVVAADDWCAEHLVPESACIECVPALLPKGKPYGFCREHGVAECVLDHPELAQVKGEPQLPKYDTAQAIGLIARAENNSRNTLHTSRVQFTSAEGVTKAGIDVDVVQERAMTESVTANGELIFDPTRVAHLATRVPGSVAYVFKTIGDEVAAGDMLALIDSAQVGEAKSQLVQSIVQLQLRQKTVDRLQPVATGGVVPQKAILEAEAALQEAEVGLVSARQALANLGFDVPEQLEMSDVRQLSDDLRFLGIPTAFVTTLSSSTRTANLIPIHAPYGGVVVDAEIVAGEVVDTSRTLYTIADPTRMWLQLSVRQEDAKNVHRGLPVTFRTDDGSQQVAGLISWISPAVDEQTRTLPARMVIDNAELKLRGQMFGSAEIILREEPSAIVVPRDAVQSTPDANFVFVRDKRYFDENAPKFFHVRQVRLGAKDDQYVELLAGALPGEVVATKGSNVLLAQLLRSNLGAGCGCHEH